VYYVYVMEPVDSGECGGALGQRGTWGRNRFVWLQGDLGMIDE